METLLLSVWTITAPMLIWSRWNGPAWIFNVVLALNALSGIAFLMKVKD